MERKRVIGLIVVGFLIAGLAGPNGPLGGFWGVEETPGLEGPTLGALMLYGMLEGIAFGAGLAWLAFGRRLASVPSSSFWAIGWMLTSWFPHGAFHQSLAHENWAGLAALEYGFHLTMIIAAAVVGRDIVRLARTPAQAVTV